ncbi:peptidase M4 [Bradyrhizobium sp. Ai1a-2]|uniref:peptidase M4 n=1 Tax=Bradyrhizobium sp. Ai1a-2 TaxID=196490 RepID=UPI0012691D08|nr:peptidase M4 [Bradyrhizobium sp. Ai1a-2]
MDSTTKPTLHDTLRPNVASSRSEGRKVQGALAASANYFVVDPVFLATASVQPYQRAHHDPICRPLRIYTLDPTASRLDGAVATINVPFEQLSSGPVGSILEVVDWDQTTGQFNKPVDLDNPRILMESGRVPSPSDPMFRQQMVYAVCASTYYAFRRALGRDPCWGFHAKPGQAYPKLRIRPQAFCDRNAYYDSSAGELKFGYFSADGDVQGRNRPHGRVFTSLSHDIIVHEMTHALLDGLRTRFRLPTHPDVPAFHEGFADLVAILTHFSHSDVVRAAIERSGAKLETDALLLSLASQFGHTTGSDGPLRSAITLAGPGQHEEGSIELYETAGDEPHKRGSLLVTAMFEAFATVLRRKTKRYLRLARLAPGEAPGPELTQILADQASTLASQFLSICIRAIDYCPPFDLRLGEYLRAVITADFDLVQDDPFGYREAIIDAFARRHIYADDVPDLAEDSLLWRPPDKKMEPIEALHFREMQFAGDPGRAADETELRRQAEALGAYVMRPEYTHAFGCALPGDIQLNGDHVDPAVVGSVRSLRRIGPDGQITFDTVAEITQRRWCKQSSKGISEVFGGSTVILGPDGQVRYVIRKSVTDRRRIQAQADYLDSKGGSKGWTKRGMRRHLPRSSKCHLFQQNVDDTSKQQRGGG